MLARKRLDTLQIGQRTWKQPPLRVWYCLGDTCTRCPAPSPCPICSQPCCATHLATHVRGVAIPPDAWRSLRKRLPKDSGIGIRYCVTPSRRHIDAPCGHRASTCHGDSHQCPACLFTYCQHHAGRHIRVLACPKQTWLAILERYEARKRRIQRGEVNTVQLGAA